MKELDIPAVSANLPAVQAFIGAQLDQMRCSSKARFQIETAVEEVFVNISNYAYKSGAGSATVRVEASDDPATVVMTFIDSGCPYNTLAKPDLDLKIPLKERKKGGLGIFMTKKTMDDVSYEYRNGQNILTLKKNL